MIGRERRSHNQIMTWVIGMPFWAGYSVLISDIRVTWGNGQEDDCLQKIYPVAPFHAVGFAGSVFAGFEMVNALRREYHLSDRARAWIPEHLAKDWQPKAQRLYQRIYNDPRVGQKECHLLFVASHPTENVGPGNWPRCYAWRMLSPDFAPDFTNYVRPISIGSGAAVETYKKALTDDSGVVAFLDFERGGPLVFAGMVLTFLGSVVAEHRVSGISEYLHLGVVTRGFEFYSQNNDGFVSPSGGEERIPFRMPPVARSWDELVAFARSKGINATEATT